MYQTWLLIFGIYPGTIYPDCMLKGTSRVLGYQAWLFDHIRVCTRVLKLVVRSYSGRYPATTRSIFLRRHTLDAVTSRVAPYPDGRGGIMVKVAALSQTLRCSDRFSVSVPYNGVYSVTVPYNGVLCNGTL